MFKSQMKGNLIAALLVLATTSFAWGQTWIPEGPSPNKDGQTENVTPDDEVAGAVETIVTHPTNADIIWAGGTNSGIWHTDDATSLRPTWVCQTLNTLDLVSLSIRDIALDISDKNLNRLVAGIGSSSSFGFSGDLTGVLGTTDGGITWTQLPASGLGTQPDISGVFVRGSTIVVAIEFASPFSFGNIGIFRSTDFGENFDQISDGDGTATGLPQGIARKLAADPQNTNRLYMINDSSSNGGDGIYRSDDMGATWTRISNATVNSAITNSSNFELEVGNSDNIFIATATGSVNGLFRSGNGGTSWESLDLPSPTIHPGGQGGIHFSLSADPENANICYMGGDRQDNPFPNSIGASNFSGNIWRINAAASPGSQAQHLTHSNSQGPAGGGTASGSSPHADSRDMAFDANGNLIESDDGGIYRRTSPQDNTGDWFSINGTLRTAEFHGLAYDSVSNIIMGGTQDTGTPFQDAPGAAPFTSISTADGGDVAVDDVGSQSTSVRYSSFQFLSSFRRSVWDANNNFISQNFPTLTSVGGDPAIQPAFYSPIQANNVAGSRLILHVSNGLFESVDEGNTVIRVTTLSTPASATSAIAYGAADNPDIIYVGGTAGRVEVRTGAPGTATTQAATFPGNNATLRLESIAVDPDQASHAFAANNSSVYRTTNTGNSWEEITNNLFSFDLGFIISVAYINREGGDRVVVGAKRGVYQALVSENFSTWTRLGEGLPNAPVFEMEYDDDDDLLVAGLMGQGAWTIELEQIVVPDCDGDFNSDSIVDQADLDLIFDAWRGDNLDFDIVEDSRINMLDLTVCIDNLGECPTAKTSQSASL